MARVKNKKGIVHSLDYLVDDVVRLVKEGKRTKAIATILHIEGSTVSYIKAHNKKLWQPEIKKKEQDYFNSVTKLCPMCKGRNHKDNKVCIYCEAKF